MPRGVRMKKLIATLILLATFNTFAKTVNCEISSSITPSSWPKDYLKVVIGKYVDSIFYIQQVPQDDGSFKEELEILYGAGVRGGRKVSYCNPDYNEVNEAIGTISTSSECMYNGDKLFFDVDLNLKKKGNIGLSIFQLNGDIVTRNFSTEICK